jgi:hypothetical protein
VKLTRTQVKLIIVALAVGIALAAWVRTQGVKNPPCHPDRVEKRDTAGKVIEITTRTCLSQKAQ